MVTVLDAEWSSECIDFTMLGVYMCVIVYVYMIYDRKIIWFLTLRKVSGRRFDLVGTFKG